ncbi:DUF2637 domain-containing protein [Prescottella equi]|uniref:DUF2637 domain-containing protein n=1 Tax=Rhodococcus hoagii TaxID=43767 RepID=UPI00131EAD2E|nr:DUF2637 domain-containing protein [Prescottella equi]
MKVSRVDAAITYVLAAVGLWLSYTALADLALRAGLGELQSRAWPLVVDGLILVATRSVFTFGKHPSKRYAWGLLVAAAAVSIVGNAAHILLPPGPVHPFIAVGVGVVPPVTALALTHLVMVRARVREELEAAAPAEAPTVAAPAAEPVPAAHVPDEPAAPEATPEPTPADAPTEELAAPVPEPEPAPEPVRVSAPAPEPARAPAPAPAPAREPVTVTASTNRYSTAGATALRQEPEGRVFELRRPQPTAAPEPVADSSELSEEEAIATAARLLAEGMSMRAIGRELNRDEKKIRRWKKEGLLTA